MWTTENRAKYNRDHLRYPSDVTDAEWAQIAPLIPPARHGGRRREVIVRDLVNGLMYVLSTGCRVSSGRRIDRAGSLRVLAKICTSARHPPGREWRQADNLVAPRGMHQFRAAGATARARAYSLASRNFQGSPIEDANQVESIAKAPPRESADLVPKTLRKKFTFDSL